MAIVMKKVDAWTVAEWREHRTDRVPPRIGGCWAYGRRASYEKVLVHDQTYRDENLKHAAWQFQVPDNADGVKAVAIALGNGMANLKPFDKCAGSYPRLGVEFVAKRRSEKSVQRFTRFHAPNLFFASASTGYREIWGGLTQAYCKELYTWDKSDWEVTVYHLRPNLPDGGVLVQSGTSCAYVLAEKRGSVWTVTLTMPVAPDGGLIGSVYHRNFTKAWLWYNDHHAE